MEVNVRMRMLGLGKAQSVERLSEEMAIELGAEMLGEFFIFSIAAATVLLEYKRSSKKEALKEEKQKHELIMLQQKMQDLDLICMVQEAQIRELQRSVDALENQTSKELSKYSSKN